MLEEGDIILCTVDRIVGTNVFVKFFDNGEEKEGTITFSEIAPGRIRNIRDYVVPRKKIVCKILRISNGNINLSLRRVTQKEQKEIMGQSKQEKSYASMFKTILGEKSEKIIKEIEKKEKLYDFLQEAKENPAKLEKAAGKTEAKKILDILKKEKQKRAVIKKEISLTSNKPNGLELIKKILGNVSGAEVKYISAGKYSIKKESDDPKKADHELKGIIENIEKQAKKEGMEFRAKEK